MELRVRRIAMRSEYTIGKLYINDEYFCDCLENKVRDKNEAKIMGKTAIPYGRYSLTLSVRSTKFSNFAKYPWAKKYDGYLPRFTNVPNFIGVLVHPGNTSADTDGCLLVGQNKEKGKVLNSVATFNRLMDEYLVPATRRGEKINITIV